MQLFVLASIPRKISQVDLILSPLTYFSRAISSVVNSFGPSLTASGNSSIRSGCSTSSQHQRWLPHFSLMTTLGALDSVDVAGGGGRVVVLDPALLRTRTMAIKRMITVVQKLKPMKIAHALPLQVLSLEDSTSTPS